MKNSSSAIFLLLILTPIFSISFRTTKHFSQDEQSLIILNLRYNSNPTTGFGGTLRIRNIETQARYEGSSIMGFNSYVIIENVSPGNYIVEEIEINTELPYNLRFNKSLIAYDTIQIEKASIYYIGNYLTYRTKPYQSHHYKITKTKNDSEKKIYKQVNKKSEHWSNLEIDYSQKLFQGDATKIDFN